LDLRGREFNELTKEPFLPYVIRGQMEKAQVDHGVEDMRKKLVYFVKDSSYLEMKHLRRFMEKHPFWTDKAIPRNKYE
jgi:hypothetical protein